LSIICSYIAEFKLRVYPQSHSTKKQIISEMFFPADLLANTEEIKANKTKADILEHNAIRGSYIAEIDATYFKTVFDVVEI